MRGWAAAGSGTARRAPVRPTPAPSTCRTARTGRFPRAALQTNVPPASTAPSPPCWPRRPSATWVSAVRFHRHQWADGVFVCLSALDTWGIHFIQRTSSSVRITGDLAWILFGTSLSLPVCSRQLWQCVREESSDPARVKCSSESRDRQSVMTRAGGGFDRGWRQTGR